VTEEINVLALVKGTERYIFLYDDENRGETLRTLGRFASKKELSFTWYDAAVLSQKVRQQISTEAPSPRFSLPHSNESHSNESPFGDNLGTDDIA